MAKMIDLRYHIYSLAAVFFALAVGIVIGSSFARSLPAGENARRTIVRYENTMRILKREIEHLSEGAAQKEELAKRYEEYCRATLPVAAKGRLLWRNVAIIQTGDYDDLSGSVTHAVELAGARITNVVDLNREFPFDDPIKVSQALQSCGIVPPSDSQQMISKLFATVVESVCEGQNPSAKAGLREAGVATFTRSANFTRARLVVLVGGASSPAGNTSGSVDAPLVSALDDVGVRVVACEGSQAVVSYVPAWSKMGIATVDNADSPMGQLALICALNGENARFGVKETADRLIPRALDAR